MERKYKKLLTAAEMERNLSILNEEETHKVKGRERFSDLSEEEIRRFIQLMEYRVLDRTAQLETANKELEAFSYSVSHDLRAPLRHINGFSDVLKAKFGGDLPEEANLYLDKIVSAGKKMDGLIDDLLKFSNTGTIRFKRSILNMNDVVEDALSQIESFNKDRMIEWNIASLPEVYGNYNLLLQVWINLLDNSVKYTRKTEKAVISIGYSHEKDELVFFVRDNGIGFDMQYSGKMFGVFQRLHLPEQFEGTGIGLAIVRRIISRHGGRTWAEAEVDKGACIFFSIPAYSDLYQGF
jgi:light-regulated signal transduction histidine kinase (bacteriophytochrome)